MTTMNPYGSEELAPPLTNTQGTQLSIEEVLTPMYEVKGWLKFIGIFSIVTGALCCISIVGIIIAWLYIWIGSLLVQSANRLNEGFLNQQPWLMHEGLEKLKSVITIVGILMLISAALFAVMIVFYIVMAVALIFSG